MRRAQLCYSVSGKLRPRASASRTCSLAHTMCSSPSPPRLLLPPNQTRPKLPLQRNVNRILARTSASFARVVHCKTTHHERKTTGCTSVSADIPCSSPNHPAVTPANGLHVGDGSSSPMSDQHSGFKLARLSPSAGEGSWSHPVIGVDRTSDFLAFERAQNRYPRSSPS